MESAYQRIAAFRQIINSKIEYQKAFAIARQIEGQPRQTSIYARVLWLVTRTLTDTIPLKIGEGYADNAV